MPMKTMTRFPLRDYLLLTVTALASNTLIHLMMLPNHFIFGGVAGFSQILAQVTGISFGRLNLWINLALLAAAFLFIGKSFGVRTVYVTLLSSLQLRLMEIWFPMRGPLTDQPILEMGLLVLGMALSSALLFNCNASSGGTDIIAMIIRKYTRANIAMALFGVDVAAVLLGFFVFGIEVGLFSLTGLLIRSFCVDTLLESFNLCKCFTIVSDHPEPICTFIKENLNRGVTTYAAEGGYTGLGKTVILTVVRRRQALQLRQFVKRNCPDAFVIITNSSEVVGQGFMLE